MWEEGVILVRVGRKYGRRCNEFDDVNAKVSDV